MVPYSFDIHTVGYNPVEFTYVLDTWYPYSKTVLGRELETMARAKMSISAKKIKFLQIVFAF
jgi:hypothetical protein